MYLYEYDSNFPACAHLCSTVSEYPCLSIDNINDSKAGFHGRRVKLLTELTLSTVPHMMVNNLDK